MKQLYEVETELVLYVMAENESEAVSIAQRNIKEEAGNLSRFDLTALKPKYCYANWEDSHPYGSDTNQTVEREEWDKRQMKMFK